MANTTSSSSTRDRVVYYMQMQVQTTTATCEDDADISATDPSSGPSWMETSPFLGVLGPDRIQDGDSAAVPDFQGLQADGFAEQ